MDIVPSTPAPTRAVMRFTLHLNDNASVTVSLDSYEKVNEAELNTFTGALKHFIDRLTPAK